MDQDPTTSFVTAGGYRLHLRQIEGDRPGMPTLVFLHEGLGTIGVWGDVPDALCRATCRPGLIYERPGYGASDPRALPWPADVLEQEAEIVLPALLEALGIDCPVLIGHSDGGTIALLYAAAFPDRVRAVITLAAHVVLDDLTFAGVTALERSWREGDLRSELGRLHGPGTETLFRGWSGLWLHPSRHAWSITDRLPHITCPVLAIQAIDDGPFVLVTVELWLSPDDGLDLCLRLIGAVARIRKLHVGDQQQRRTSQGARGTARANSGGVARGRRPFSCHRLRTYYGRRPETGVPSGNRTRVFALKGRCPNL